MAGYGRFTGYSEIPDKPGAYQFGTANGPPVTLFGPQAEDLRAKIDASNAAGRMANWGAPAPPQTGGQFARPAPPPARRDAGGPAPAPPPPTAVTLPEQEVVGDAQAPPQVEARMKGGALLVTDPITGAAQVIEPPRRATKGGMQEVSRTEKGAFDPNQEYLEQQNEANIDLRLAKQQARDAAAQATAEQIGIAEGVQEAQRVAAEEALKERDQIEAGVAEKQAAYDQAREAYNSSEIDPDRYKRSTSGVISGIGAVLGTIASSLPGKVNIPNYALQITQKRIDDDIRKQEVELAVKKDAANNALGDLQRQLGSRTLAREAYRGLMLEQAQTQIQTAGLRAQDAEQQAQYEEWEALNAKALSDQHEKYRIEARGEVTRSIKNIPGQAGSSGGKRPLTLDERRDFVNVRIAEGKARGDGGPADKPTPQAQKAQALEAEASGHAERLAQYDDKAAPETKGILQRAGRGALDVALGTGSASQILDDEKDLAAKQDFADAKEFIKSARAALRGKRALSDSASAQADKALAPGATVGEVKRALVGLRETLRKVAGQKGGSASQSPPTEEPTE